jgi:hypothetical protein
VRTFSSRKALTSSCWLPEGKGTSGMGTLRNCGVREKMIRVFHSAIEASRRLRTLQRGSQPSCTLKMRRRSAGMLSSGGEVSETVQSALKSSHTLGFASAILKACRGERRDHRPSAEVLVKAPKAHHSILAVPSILALIDRDTTLKPSPPLPPTNGDPEHNHPVHKIVHAHDGRPRALHPLDGVTMSEHNLGIGVSPRQLDVAV